MSERITAKIFDFFITTKCTMNCKLCAAAVPYNPKPRHTPKEIAFRELSEFFQIWDYAERVEFIGGEPLMHPDIYDIVKETMKYSNQFDRMRITTNATIVPSDELLSFIADCGKPFDFIVDDYGKHSKNLNRLVEKLETYGIEHRIDVYHGETQRFDGWVCFGDYTDLAYSEEEWHKVFERCIAPKNAFTCVNDGKAFACCYAMSLYWVNGFLADDGSYVDLFDDGSSIEKKRETAANFNKQPLAACRCCHGFDSENGKRYPAAEQLPKIMGGNVHE
ncbi:hypothetical protein FACS1894111_10690 [Clostridia bacterium]|nr:hypothetical protein FACS1894111_10690 [Clostridia bacterium]